MFAQEIYSPMTQGLWESLDCTVYPKDQIEPAPMKAELPFPKGSLLLLAGLGLLLLGKKREKSSRRS